MAKGTKKYSIRKKFQQKIILPVTTIHPIFAPLILTTDKLPKDMLRKKSTIKNPCIHVCTLDENNICMGCYRTKEEIRGWIHFTDEEKLSVLKKTEERKKNSEKDNYDRYV